MEKQVLDFVELVTNSFRSCFTRKAAWGWFCVLVVSFMLRSDKLGITSAMRDLALASLCYDSLVHFFKSDAWSLSGVRTRWFQIVRDHAPLWRTPNGRCVLIADGKKQSKEARRQPGVKKLHQESENSAKGEYIFGHMLGGLGVIAERAGAFACIPLSIRIHDGLREAAQWICGKAVSVQSHVVQMVDNACEAARELGDSYLVMDRYFLTVPALEALARNNASGPRVDIITRAKRNVRGFGTTLLRKRGGRGRPAKKGVAVPLEDMFVTMPWRVRDAEIKMYGKLKKVRWMSEILHWGEGLYQKLLFVVVEEVGGERSIFACTDLTLDPLKVVELYTRRFRIECMFRELSQQIGAFCYRFWTKCLDKLNHFQKADDPSPIANVTDEKDQKKVLKTARAIEMHLIVSCVAMGILQILSLRLNGNVDPSEIRYLRTPSKERISEGTLMYWMRHNFLRLLRQKPDSPLSRFIRDAQARHT